MRENDVSKIAGAFLLGGLVGAAVALLYAPKSGIETRKDISRTTGRMKKKAVDLVEETVESVNEFAGDVKERANDIIERGVDLSENAKKEIIKTLEHGQKAIEKQRKRLIDALGL